MKQVESVRDLAINGAEPAFKEPLHVGRPSIGDRNLFLRYTEEILDRQWFTNNGPVVQELERRIADYHNVGHCVATCSGTVALEIAIRALQLEGEVIVPSHTFIATAHALYWQAITPVFADIDPTTHNLDPQAVRRAITPQTSGIIGVHLWGRVAPVEALQKIADEHDLALMFDAAHAFSCTHGGVRVGNFGRYRQIDQAYRRAVSDIPMIALLEYDERESNKYQYVVLEVGENSPVSRDQMVNALNAENILARRYFWPGCHRTKPYIERYPKANQFLANSERVSERVIVMPTGPAMDSACPM